MGLEDGALYFASLLVLNGWCAEALAQIKNTPNDFCSTSRSLLSQVDVLAGKNLLVLRNHCLLEEMTVRVVSNFTAISADWTPDMTLSFYTSIKVAHLALESQF